MEYFNEGHGIKVTGTGLDISQTLECGQCFRHEKTDGGYRLIAHSRLLNITQDEEGLSLYPCTAEEFETIWRNYFDLDGDYAAAQKFISERDSFAAEAVSLYPGLRFLNQEPFETLVSFIISQNNNIPRIKKIIGLIAEKYGGKRDGYCCFPTSDELTSADISELMACNTGFRARYIMDLVGKIASGDIVMNELSALDSSELKKKLLTILGVGEKVSDCVMLFGFGRREVFPVDTWVRQVMNKYFFPGNPQSDDYIRSFAAERFGPYAGYAQQVLFHHIRSIASNEAEINKKSKHYIK